jgi:integrase
MATKPSKWPKLAHGDGTWAYDAERQKIELRHVIGGKRHRERGETTQECIAKRNRRRRDSDSRGRLFDGGQATVAEMLQDWLAFERQGKAPQTTRNYEWSIRYLTEHLGDLPAAELDVAHIERMYSKLVDGGRGLGSASMVKLRSHLSLAVKFGVRRKYLPESARTLVRTSVTPDGASRARRKVWYDLHEYDAVRAELLYRAPTSPRYALFLTMLLCGLRPGEAAGLRWEHVDLVRGIVHVEGTIQRQENCKSGAYTTVLKTDRHGVQAHREIPMTPDLRLVLTELQRTADCEYVFSEGGTFLSFNVLALTAQQIARDVGVKNVHPNGYRHSFASMCRHGGMPYELLAKLMGHKDASMIIQTYGHPIVATETIDMTQYLGGSMP